MRAGRLPLCTYPVRTMKLVFALLICLSVLACSRQPVRVDAVDPTSAAPAAPAPDATPERAPEANDRGTTAAPADGPVASTPTTRPDTSGQNPTPEVDIPVVDTETNETAQIERQGSVGEAPLGGPQKGIVPGKDTRMQLSKSACFGICDVYTLQLLHDNRAVLDVTNGLQGPGTYDLTFDGVAARDLGKAIEALKKQDLALQYPDDPDAALPVDVQITRVTLPDAAGELRTITVYYDAPPALQRFIDEVQAYVEDALAKKTTTDR